MKNKLKNMEGRRGMSRYKIGDIVQYGKEVIRLTRCWRCEHSGEYEWRESGYPYGYGEKIPHSKKIYCEKTKRWGSPDRAYFCTQFKSNSDSYHDPYKERTTFCNN